MLEGERHALERRAHVAGLLDRTLEHLHADGHQSAPPSLVAGSNRARSYRARWSFWRLRLSRREYAGLMSRPRSMKPNTIATSTRLSTSIATANCHDAG